MYTMKYVCEQTQLSYETLKFYCNQGLVPNVKRDKNNRRLFDERDIAWIQSLNCLKNCGMNYPNSFFRYKNVWIILIGSKAFMMMSYPERPSITAT